MGETARARGYLRPPTAGYFYIDILARAAARGRRPEGCGAGSYRPNGQICPLPKPKFGRGDGRLAHRPAVAPSGWRETAVPMRGHRHHSRIGRANALTGRHARPACPSSGPPASPAAASWQAATGFDGCARMRATSVPHPILCIVRVCMQWLYFEHQWLGCSK